MGIGDKILVRPIFEPVSEPRRSYTWKSSDSSLVDIFVNHDKSSIITALRNGSTTVEFSSNDGAVSTSFEIHVETVGGDDGILKVLAIGNSFSEDAVENNLYELARAEGVTMVIGNLYIGGASLERHWNNAQSNATAYNYRKISTDGNKTRTPGASIEMAILDENWDYISFQQVSGHSGEYDTYITPLTGLLEYAKEKATNTETGYILHQTWAYAQNSTHADFPRYDRDQEQMYQAIMETVSRIENEFEFDLVIPSGTAIQNGRNTLVGDYFNRDGYHLDMGIGRYTAACTWFEALTGINVTGNAYAPESVSGIQKEIAQHSAHAAILQPYAVTVLEDYQPEEEEEEEVPSGAAIYINLGTRTAPVWNTLDNHVEGTSIEDLKNSDDEFTGISVTITQRFNGINTGGPNTTDTGNWTIPGEVSSQSYFGNAKGVWENMEITQSQLTLSGLDTGKTYKFCFFGARSGVSDNRETRYTVSGANEEAVSLQTAGNSSETACTDEISPDAQGKIVIDITAGDNNNNGNGFFYLNAMQIIPVEE
ncbi:hypothetical protein DN748_02200 [Sinomicrobium soli]|nr:hypothetical protein DN748_02200 [Sinomicrobium sp. N-1-3-6]